MDTKKPMPGGQIYTLAQSGTANEGENNAKANVYGTGTEIVGNPVLLNRAKRKVITRSLIYALVDIAKQRGDLGVMRSYWNTYHCQNNLISHKNRIYGKYCKNRICTICNANRKADFINRYYPTISQWKEMYFVTLTVKSVKEDKLRLMVSKVLQGFNLVRKRCDKRYQRGVSFKMIGLKSLECNFNPATKTYNPHLHIIVPYKETAVLLKDEWLKQWKHERIIYASPKAQHIRKVEDVKRDLSEIIKYGSKIFTEPDINKKTKNAYKSTLPPIIYAKALDTILMAMKGKRLTERFGFNLPKNLKQPIGRKTVTNYENWNFEAGSTDWVNPKTGECLTGFLQPFELWHLLNECINTETH